MKKIILPKKKNNRIYVIIYDQQEFYGHDSTIPVKAFKTKKNAELYANSRNFEFQSICMFDEEDYENYVLGNQNSDYIISVSDFREAHGFIKEEVLRLEKNKMPVNIWAILEDIKPFKIVPIEYISDINKI